ncbi:DUF5666 domain-containing protein [Rhodococcus cercidiphylli]|uniref:DUF5666 domain-containing protein n=1 Tax=Rhodococcus cercidiphylli TaxID=489916 RepID=A0ABU4B5J1_9NOCA|nr:DUF5666 domain-containing protein [Rhodococcus cercidiphylli]MDV6233762.1 DUF5666 domain-containing protein [Rhodococcus cercidiphylli]
MTNPDDPRSPRERDQDAAPQAEPSEPTQDYGRPYPGAQQYPDGAHPTEAYPTQAYQNPAYQNPAYQDPTQQNPAQQNPDPQAYPPGYQPTQAFPPYDPEQQAAANQAYGQTQQYGQGYGTGQYGQPQQYGNTQQFGHTQQFGQPPEYGAPPPGNDPNAADSGSKGPRPWVLALIGLVVLAIVVVFGISFLSGGSDESTTASAPSTSIRPPTSSAPTTTPQPTESGTATTPELIPGGIPEILGQLGSSVGTISANDGSTLTLDGLDGAPVTVQTTPQTQIISLSGSDLASLAVGAFVVVQGEAVEDGTIRANVIIETPSLGG